jgi:hypothetical protein
VADAATGAYQSGAQTVGLVYANTLNKTAAGNPADIVNGAVQPAKSATICLSDGTRYAAVFVGGSNDNQLNISVQQLGTTPCL